MGEAGRDGRMFWGLQTGAWPIYSPTDAEGQYNSLTQGLCYQVFSGIESALICFIENNVLYCWWSSPHESGMLTLDLLWGHGVKDRSWGSWEQLQSESSLGEIAHLQELHLGLTVVLSWGDIDKTLPESENIRGDKSTTYPSHSLKLIQTTFYRLFLTQSGTQAIISSSFRKEFTASAISQLVITETLQRQLKEYCVGFIHYFTNSWKIFLLA